MRVRAGEATGKRQSPRTTGYNQGLGKWEKFSEDGEERNDSGKEGDEPGNSNRWDRVTV